MYGRLRVKLGLLNCHGDIAVRKMEVTTVVEDKSWQAVHVEMPANSLVVTMIQLTSWPEQGLPHPTSITSLADHLTNAQMRSSTKQTVVMCKYEHCVSIYIQTPLILYTSIKYQQGYVSIILHIIMKGTKVLTLGAGR